MRQLASSAPALVIGRTRRGQLRFRITSAPRSLSHHPNASWPAPADLARDGAFACLDFVNSEWTDWRGVGPATDRLTAPDWWKRFLLRWGLNARDLKAPKGAQLSEMRRLRRVMRTALEKVRAPTRPEISWLNSRLAVAPQRWTVAGGTTGIEYRIIPTRPGWPAVTSALILSFAELLSDPDRSRLKRCANPDCSYLFYDVSTNRSRRWCFSNVCGNMMHVRAFRGRVARN